MTKPPGAPLTAADLAMLKGCGITEKVAQAALLRRVTTEQGAELIGRRTSSESDFSGILIPFVWPGEADIREVQLRRDYPDLESRPEGPPKEKGKYLFPPGRGNLLYFPPGVDPALLADATLPAIVVEGAKKALALSALAWQAANDSIDKPGWLPIAIPGVWNWRGVNGKTTSADGKRTSTKGPIGDLSRVNWRSRKVTVLFDSNVRAKPDVQAARWELSKYLRSRGAQVYWFEWPQNTPASVNGIDDLIGEWGFERVLEAIQKFTHPAPANFGEQQNSPREFTQISEDRYVMSIPALGTVFEIDRLRRDHHELWGELTVKCDLPGTRSYNGVLIASDFNVSSSRVRSERAKLLAERAKTSDLDWLALVEEFCQRVLEAERKGQPAQDLRDFPEIAPQQMALCVQGIDLLREHPTVFFGDGGSAKSYLALWIAGQMSQKGLRVALFDWELSGPEHRVRLKNLFGTAMPRILYARCERPLIAEADRLRRIVDDEKIEYAIYDSVAVACDGPPESAESAARYFRAVRSIGCGSGHIAHVSKAQGSDQTPFGSAFWNNLARATWYVKRVETIGAADNEIKICLYNRKANLTARQARPLAFRIRFQTGATTFEPDNPANTPEFAEGMSLKWRMYELLRRAPLNVEAIAEDLGASLDTVKKYARDKSKFVVLDAGKVALKTAG